MSDAQTAFDQKFNNYQTDQNVDMLEAKLWGNPCPFTFRINYLALLYNTPLYTWVQDTYGLKRSEYVVLYSLALADGGSARDISHTSCFPKNTLSRAIKRLELMGLINTRYKAPGSGRTQALHLSEKGWTLFNETSPTFEAQEKQMLTVLSDGERQILFELMSKVVTGASEWKSEISIDTMIKTEAEVQ